MTTTSLSSMALSVLSTEQVHGGTDGCDAREAGAACGAYPSSPAALRRSLATVQLVAAGGTVPGAIAGARVGHSGATQ